MLYQFHTVMTEKDYYDFNKYHHVDSPVAKKHRLKWQLYIAGLFLLMFLRYALAGEEVYLLIWLFVCYAVFALILILLMKPLTLLLVKRMVRRMKKKEELFYSPTATMEFYEDYFVETNEKFKTEIKYDAVVNLVVNPGRAIYIYQNPAMAYTIPFNTFENDAVRQEFIAFITQKTEKSSK
ncbi:MAG: YcxB family protein [Clostridia bacterium]|nr:YcxB family protein [Clostridia bacterium]